MCWRKEQLESTEVVVVTKFIKDETESCSNDDVDNVDNDDDEQGRIIRFR